MVELVEWMDAVIQAPEDDAVIQRVGDAVREILCVPLGGVSLDRGTSQVL